MSRIRSLELGFNEIQGLMYQIYLSSKIHPFFLFPLSPSLFFVLNFCVYPFFFLRVKKGYPILLENVKKMYIILKNQKRNRFRQDAVDCYLLLLFICILVLDRNTICVKFYLRRSNCLFCRKTISSSSECQVSGKILRRSQVGRPTLWYLDSALLSKFEQTMLNVAQSLFPWSI